VDFSKGPNSVGVSLSSAQGGNTSNLRNAVISSYLEFRTMAEFHKAAIPSAVHHRQNPLGSSKHSALLAACLSTVSFVAYAPTLKMQSVCSSEACVNFCQRTRRQTPEHSSTFLKATDICAQAQCFEGTAKASYWVSASCCACNNE
jgi:hypothetical protein